MISKKQQIARANFKKAIKEAQALRKKNPKLTQTEALKKAFTLSKKVGAVKKKIGDYKLTDVTYKDIKGKKLKSKPKYKTTRTKKGTFLNFSKIGTLYEFFDVKSLTDIDSLKKMYFKQSKIYHPDAGGTNEAFKRLKNEYDLLFKTVISGSNLTENDIENEINLDENLRNAVDAIIGIENINVELIGKWIWVSGNTYPIRKELQMAGFMFAPVKKMWYYKGIESSGRGKSTIDEIRKKYGSQSIQKESMKKIQGIDNNISTIKKRKFYLSLKKALKFLNKRKDQKIIISGIINNIH